MWIMAHWGKTIFFEKKSKKIAKDLTKWPKFSIFMPMARIWNSEYKSALAENACCPKGTRGNAFNIPHSVPPPPAKIVPNF
jgi:hypothetical protein